MSDSEESEKTLKEYYILHWSEYSELYRMSGLIYVTSDQLESTYDITDEDTVDFKDKGENIYSRLGRLRSMSRNLMSKPPTFPIKVLGVYKIDVK